MISKTVIIHSLCTTAEKLHTNQPHRMENSIMREIQVVFIPWEAEKLHTNQPHRMENSIMTEIQVVYILMENNILRGNELQLHIQLRTKAV